MTVLKPHQIRIHHMPPPKVETPIVVEVPKLVEVPNNRPITRTGMVHYFRRNNIDIHTYACGTSIATSMGTWIDREVSCDACKSWISHDKTPLPIRPTSITHGHVNNVYSRTYACGASVGGGTISCFSVRGITCKACLYVMDPPAIHGFPKSWNTDDLRWACGEALKNKNYAGGSAYFTRVTCQKCKDYLRQADGLMHWYSNPYTASQFACGKPITTLIRGTWNIVDITCKDCNNKVFRGVE